MRQRTKSHADQLIATRKNNNPQWIARYGKRNVNRASDGRLCSHVGSDDDHASHRNTRTRSRPGADTLGGGEDYRMDGIDAGIDQNCFNKKATSTHADATPAGIGEVHRGRKVVTTTGLTTL
jgi:hypothetical protein